MKKDNWVRLPTHWIHDRELTRFRWGSGGGDETAALMTLIALVHGADQETGVSNRTYDELCTATGISRAKVSSGLKLLLGRDIVATGEKRGHYELVGFEPTQGYCMLPVARLYSGGEIQPFKEFYLRKKAELNALKLYLLFACHRSRQTNMAHIGFDKIEAYTGVRGNDIKAATSMLAALSMVYIERLPSSESEAGVHNAYRLVGLEPKRHMGTTGRRMMPSDFEEMF